MVQQFGRASWEVYRQELESLYLSKKKSLKEIRACMKTKYNFDATLNQYETIFREWGFRKNLTNADWEFVDYRTKKRKASDMDSESAVYLNGVLVPEKKVKREIYRRFPSYKQWYPIVPSPKTPPGIEVRTPGPCSNRAISGTAGQFGTNFEFGEFAIHLNNLPSCRYRQLVDEHFIGTWGKAILSHFEPTHQDSGPAHLTLSTILASESTTKLAQAQQRQTGALHAPSGAVQTSTGRAIFLDGLSSALHEDLKHIYFEEESSLESRIQVLVGYREGDSLSEFIRFAGYLSSNNMLSDAQSDKLLQWVVSTGNLPALEQFCSIRLPTVESFARCLFESAVFTNQPIAVETLIRCGVNHNVPMRRKSPWYEIMRWRCLNEEMTPLMWSVYKNYGPVFHALINANGDVNYTTKKGISALHIAVRSGKSEMTKLLLGHTDSDLLSSDQSLLEFLLPSICRDASFNIRILKMLLDHGFSAVDRTNINPCQTALQSAALHGNYDLVQFLLDAGANVNAPSAVPMPYGSYWGGTLLQHQDFARKWSPLWYDNLEEEAPNEEFETYVGIGAHRVVAQWLLDAGVDINAPALLDTTKHYSYRETCVTALQGAVSYGSAPLTNLLLKAGAEINAPPCMLVHEGGTALQLAIAGKNWANRSERLSIVELLILLGADVNAPACLRGSTALIAAISTKDFELTKLVIQAGADVNLPTPEGRTPLIAAIRTKDFELIKLVIQAGADVNPTTSEGPTPLIAAIYTKNITLVNMLLEFGVNASATKNSRSRTALEAAIDTGDIAIVERLLNAGVDVNPGLSTHVILYSAATQKDPEIAVELITMLFDHGAVDNLKYALTYAKSVLVGAIEEGNFTVARLLLNKGADVNGPEYRSALEAAVDLNIGGIINTKNYDLHRDKKLDYGTLQKERVSIIQDLIKLGSRINIKRKLWNLRVDNEDEEVEEDEENEEAEETYISNPLPLAVVQYDMEIFEILLSAGADINGIYYMATMDDDDDGGGGPLFEELGITVLTMAVYNSLYDMVIAALGAGANVNQRKNPYGGPTALQVTAEKGDIRIVEVLLQFDADINADADPKGGRTALQAAIIEGHPKVAKLLLDQGADVNAPAAKLRGITALQAAAIRGYIPLALELLKRGADPNAPPAEFDGRTAMEAAAEHGRLDMLQLLLNAGADVGGDNPQRAKKLALDNQHYVVADYLAEKFMV